MYTLLFALLFVLIVGHERMTNVPIMTQWGCPYACDFCAVIHMFGRRVRARRIEDVLAELETYRDQGPVFFYDDNFVVDKARTRALLEGMIARGLTPGWSAQMRADVVYIEPLTVESVTRIIEKVATPAAVLIPWMPRTSKP